MSRRAPPLRPGLTVLALALAALAAGGGCGGRKVAGGGPETQLRPGDEVVATVDGVPISAARVAAHGRVLGAAPHAALDDLVKFELLAQAAARRGLGASPEVAEARTRELARRLLQAEFESRTRPEDIPEADVRRELERNRRFFEHPELRAVLTVLFAAKRGAASPQDDARAKAAAQELAERWRAERPADAKAARAIVDTYYGQLGGMQVSQFNTYKDAPAEPEWLKVALAMKEPGAVSAPVRTRYGWHVIYLAELHPEKRTPEAEALATVRREMHPLWQRAAFARFLDEAAGRHAVAAHPERIPAAAAGAFPPPPPEPGATAP